MDDASSTDSFVYDMDEHGNVPLRAFAGVSVAGLSTLDKKNAAAISVRLGGAAERGSGTTQQQQHAHTHQPVDPENPNVIPLRVQELPAPKSNWHVQKLLFATWLVLLNNARLFGVLLLLYKYNDLELYDPMFCLGAIWVLEAWVSALFDYLNRGRVLLVPLDLIQQRLTLNYVQFIAVWYHYRHREWNKYNDAALTSSIALESFLGVMPTLMVEVFVILSEPSVLEDDDDILFILLVHVLYGCYNLMNFYKTLGLSRHTYVVLYAKGLMNSALRIFLTAYLMWTFDLSTSLMCIGGSFLLNVYGYMRGKWYLEKNDHDQVFIKRFVSHVAFGGLVSLNMLYFSFPAAPSYVMEDWWKGYTLAEVKILIENIAMATFALLEVYEKAQDSNDGTVLFWAVAVFSLSQLVANGAALRYLKWIVKKQVAVLPENYSSELAQFELQRVCAWYEGRFHTAKERRKENKNYDQAERRYLGYDEHRGCCGWCIRTSDYQVMATTKNVAAAVKIQRAWMAFRFRASRWDAVLKLQGVFRRRLQAKRIEATAQMIFRRQTTMQVKGNIWGSTKRRSRSSDFKSSSLGPRNGTKPPTQTITIRGGSLGKRAPAGGKGRKNSRGGNGTSRDSVDRRSSREPERGAFSISLGQPIPTATANVSHSSTAAAAQGGKPTMTQRAAKLLAMREALKNSMQRR